MNDQLKKFLRGWIEQAIARFSLSSGAPNLGDLINDGAKLDQALKKVHPDLSAERAGSVLVYELLRKSISTRFDYKQLSGLEGKILPIERPIREEIAGEVVDFLSSLPRQTITLVPVHSVNLPIEGFFELGGGFALLQTTAVKDSVKGAIPAYIQQWLREPKPDEFLQIGPAIQNGTYLCRIRDGIPTPFAGRETFGRSFDDIKVWLGIGRRLTHFIDQGYGLLAAMSARSQRDAYLLDVETGEINSQTLSHDEWPYLSKQSLQISGGDISNYGKTFVEYIEPLFSSKDLTSSAAAYQWLVDAKLAQNNTASFLNCCFGLEAALGDEANSESIGTTTLLAERCAYLVGETSSERVQIRDQFRKLYVKRSKLVHGQQRRMPFLGDNSLAIAQDLLERVAFAEWSKYIRHVAQEAARERLSATRP